MVEQNPRLVVALFPFSDTEDVILASENLSEDEAIAIEMRERLEFVDSYTEGQVRDAFIKYVTRRVSREEYPISILRYPYRSWIRRRRVQKRFGGSEMKTIGGWWRARIVVPVHQIKHGYEALGLVGTRDAHVISLWFNPAMGRWRAD